MKRRPRPGNVEGAQNTTYDRVAVDDIEKEKVRASVWTTMTSIYLVGPPVQLNFPESFIMQEPAMLQENTLTTCLFDVMLKFTMPGAA